MYGRDEHRYYMARFGDVNRECDAQRDVLASLIGEWRDDNNATDTPLSDAAREVLNNLRAARTMVGEAMEAVDRAVALLPTPVAR